MARPLFRLSLLLVLMIVSSCVYDHDAPSQSLQPGDRIPDFSVTTLDGNILDSSTFAKGRGAILFFSVACEDCRRELPEIEQQYRRLTQTGASDINLVCISRDDDVASVRRFCEELGLTMPVVATGGKELYYRFAQSGVPRLYLVDGDVIKSVWVETLPDDCLAFLSTK